MTTNYSKCLQQIAHNNGEYNHYQDTDINVLYNELYKYLYNLNSVFYKFGYSNNYNNEHFYNCLCLIESIVYAGENSFSHLKFNFNEFLKTFDYKNTTPSINLLFYQVQFNIKKISVLQ
jgi:hypothetical protein